MGYVCSGLLKGRGDEDCIALFDYLDLLRCKSLARGSHVRKRGTILGLCNGPRLDIPWTIAEDLTGAQHDSVAIQVCAAIEAHPAPRGKIDDQQPKVVFDF